MHLYASDFGDRAMCGASAPHRSIVTNPEFATCPKCLAGRLRSLQADAKLVEQRLAEMKGCPACGGTLNPLESHPGHVACSGCEHVQEAK